MSRFSPIQKIKAAQQVAASIREAIVAGELAPGDAIPSERALAEDFAVNRSTIREALHHLEAWGFVAIRQGGSTTVRDVLATAGLHLLPWLVAPRGEPDPKLIGDLLELRVMVLSWTARLAARRSPDLSRLDAIVTAMSAPDADVQTLDFDFFEALINATNNQVLAMLGSALRDVYFTHRTVFSPLYTVDRFDPGLHRTALTAIAASDGAAAAAAMEIHARKAEGLFSETTP
ncbi:MAG: GntR family transcriptional repressor for pyruvate dehydrogenase complex [Myxococcota bacterium]|jgi:GntR family transcriptional repressor for pyruvate dehydrogenase complex